MDFLKVYRDVGLAVAERDAAQAAKLCIGRVAAIPGDCAFLTGSQFFKTADAASDTDWMVRDSAEARQFLEECGFQKVAEPDNVQVRAVYQNLSDNVHVILVDDPRRRALIQWAILLAELGPYLRDKTLARNIWRMGMLLTKHRGQA